MQFKSVRLETLAWALPEEVWPSALVEEKLEPVYSRLRLPQGRLELMSGIRERRFWKRPVLASEASSWAGAKALEQTRFDRDSIELLAHAGVCRDRLEPATASGVHHRLGLAEGAQIFDVSNACLGFLNGLTLAAGMIESGQIRRALVVSGEDGRPLVENTIAQLNGSDLTRKTIKPYFANLTIGAGAVAAVVCHEDEGPANLPRLLGGVAATDTSHNELCQGDTAGGGLDMRTEAEELLHAGLELAERCWGRFRAETGWDATTPDRIFCHQVGRAHRNGLYETLGLDLAKDFSTFETLGNVGSVSLPITLALGAEAGLLVDGSRAALLGIGSGLSSMMLAVEWGTGIRLGGGLAVSG